MRRKTGNLCIILGTALILGALILFLHNKQEERLAHEASEVYLEQLVCQINRAEETAPQAETGEDEDGLLEYIVPEIPEALLTAEDLEMTETVVDGRSYIGYLALPALNLELPILADWNYGLLQVAPCRYYGTLRGNDLVLMAHNYASHFGRISELRQGDSVIFVDAEGRVTQYVVVGQDVLAPNAVEEMTAGDFDLTLFTCTYGGKSRVTVYCDRAS